MHIVFVDRIEQVEHADWLWMVRDKMDRDATEMVCVARPKRNNPSDMLYETELTAMRDGNSTLFFHGTECGTLVVDDDVLQVTLMAMSLYFLGSPLNKVRDCPENFAGLPFWSLLAFNDRNTLFPPSRMGSLAVDFDNVTTDGEEASFRDKMINRPGDYGEVWNTYTLLKKRIKHGAPRQGSFYCEPAKN